MNQNEFFNILMDGLKDFPEIKLQDIISYYENSFTLGLASGKTEEEIINDLGNPNLIVDNYRNEDLKTPINTEYVTTDSDITPISNKNSIIASNSAQNNNSINTDEIFIKDQNIVAHDNSNDLYHSNPSSDGQESTHQYNSSNKANYSLNNENNSSSNNNNSHFNNKNSKNEILHFNVNTILKICIVCLALIIFFPVIAAIIGCIIGLFGAAIGILFGSIGLLIGGTFSSFIGLPNVPMFVANFPYPVIVLFSLGSISLSILLILLFYYLCKFFIQISIKAYKLLKSKGGACL